MAFTDADLLSIVQWFLPDVQVLATEALGAGQINDTYRVTSAQGPSFVLQRLNTRVFPRPEAVMYNIDLLSRRLVEAGYPLRIAAPVCNTEGASLYQSPAMGHWRMFSYLENTYAPLKADHPDEAYEAAWAFGTFIRNLATFQPQLLEITIPHFHDPVFRWGQLEEATKTRQIARRMAAADAVSFLKEHSRQIDRFDHLWKEHLPLRVVHNDTKISNVLLQKETRKAVAVIDLDTALPGTVLSDFGDMVRTFTPNFPEDHPDATDLAVRAEIMNALCEGFLSACGDILTPIERNHLYEGALTIVFEQAVRFLTDYLNGDVYYKTTHPDHNLDRTRNQIALYQYLLSYRQELSKALDR